MYDLIIVGSGPAGLAAALSAKRHGLSFVVLERGVLADTIYHYPIARQLFSTPDEIELQRGALLADVKPTREDVLRHYGQVVVGEGIEIHTDEEVQNIIPGDRGLILDTSKGRYHSRTVLVAIGGFGRQRKLGVPGESPERVSYRLMKADSYRARSVLIVGGGNSAAEAALFLKEAGAQATLSMRRALTDISGGTTGSATAKIKPWVLNPLEEAAAKGLIKIICSSEVVEIRPRSALLRVAQAGSGDLVEVPCDHILALIGADPDTRLLEKAGAKIAEDGRPIYDPASYETTIEGLYVAGHITRQLHMKNAVEVAPRVVDQIASAIFEKSVV